MNSRFTDISHSGGNSSNQSGGNQHVSNTISGGGM